MRWPYITVLALLAAVVVVFAFQNLQLVTISFLGFQLRAPIALLAVLIYLLGMVTGSGVIALLVRSMQAARRDGPDSGSGSERR